MSIVAIYHIPLLQTLQVEDVIECEPTKRSVEDMNVFALWRLMCSLAVE